MDKNEVAGLVTEALLREYQQRDMYETYNYYLFGLSSPAIQTHLEEHLKQEMAHIEILQRYLAELGVEPVLERLPIPEVAPPIENILKQDLKMEHEAVILYSTLANSLDDGSAEWVALRVDIENILIQEKEHVHDLERWLGGKLPSSKRH